MYVPRWFWLLVFKWPAYIFFRTSLTYSAIHSEILLFCRLWFDRPGDTASKMPAMPMLNSNIDTSMRILASESQTELSLGRKAARPSLYSLSQTPISSTTQISRHSPSIRAYPILQIRQTSVRIFHNGAG